jgi:hypothetical protein
MQAKPSNAPLFPDILCGLFQLQVQKLHDEYIDDIEQLRKRKEGEIEASHHP